MAITLEQVRSAGVVGAGGAGFPTHVKLAGQADTVIINAAECEPLLHKDKELCKGFAAELTAGLAESMHLVGAKRGVIGIKEKYVDVIDLLGRTLKAGQEICPLADVYPAGDEFILVYNVLGRVIPPGGIPLNVNAVVMNVETAINVARAGAGPVTRKYLTIAGAVANPTTLEVPLGMTLAQCVAAAGGPTIPDANYVLGGVMMGTLEDNHDALVDKTTGGVIVLPSTSQIVSRRRRDWKAVQRIGRSACDQCSFCTELCPRYLLGHPIEPHRAMRSLGFNRVGGANVKGTAFCCGCNLCSFYSCPEDLDPREVCWENRTRQMQAGKWINPPFNEARPAQHMANRQAPIKRLMKKLGLTGYANVGPLAKAPLEARRVGIKLKQHVGAPCEPAVQVGSSVTAGQVVGDVPVTDGKPALGAPVHASITGTVTAIDNGVIWIEG
jgi:Na+-translocating ferredoxin:NAD+ oxidoreductase RnfC subunit